MVCFYTKEMTDGMEKTVKNDTYFYVLFYESETGTKTKTGYITVMW